MELKVASGFIPQWEIARFVDSVVLESRFLEPRYKTNQYWLKTLTPIFRASR